MSLQIAANHLASKGRGPDTQLVHMAPNEVAGLQALAKAHGGSLTVNPETGLAEAGFLSNILPTVIGAGLMATGVGSPLAIGLMTGAAGTLISGDLKKGLMAGLGAYGGAGMMGSVLGAGAGAAMEAAPLAGGIDGTTAAMQGGFGAGAEQLGSVAGQGAAAATPAQVTGIPGFGGSSVGLTPPPSFTPPVAAVPTPSPAPVTQMPVDYAARNQAMADAAKQQMGINDASFADKLASAPDRIGKGISGIMQNPSQLMTGENLRYGLAAAAPALMATPQQAGYTPDTEQSKFTYSPGRVQNPEEGYTGPASGERRYFNPVYTRMADGGPVGQMSDRNEQLTLLANGGQQFAEGGITDLGGYSDGGRLLRGPGNGTSDSIPATIAGKRPARLADGEFVIPSRIVSELGNGSTEAGARQLYAMMDRIQKARAKTVGKNKVAVDANARNELPA